MDKRILLSIIIVNWKVKDMLVDCLASIKAQMRLPPEQYEIVVVDNASADGSVEMLKDSYPEVILLASDTNLGFGAGCNRGYRLSSGQFVLLLNPDTLIVDHAIDRLLETLLGHPEAGMIGACLLNDDGSFQRVSGGAFPSLWNIAWNYLLLHRLLPKSLSPAPLFFEESPSGIVDIDWVSGAAMLLRREAIGAAIFDESYFMYGEDWDICNRLHRQGWRVLFDSEAKILHFQRSSFKKQSSIDLLQAVYKGPRQFFARKHSRPALLLYDLILLTGYALRWPMYSLLDALKPNQGYRELADFSRQFLVSIARSAFSSSWRR